MGKLLFGTQNTITCIQHVEAKGSDGESLCLAYKHTAHFFGAGVYMTDDGYVLGVESKGKVDTYYSLDAAKIEELQGQSLLPRPLPKYQIPWIEWAFGYSLWIVLAGSAIWYVISERLKKKRIAARAAEAAVTPISYGPPPVSTKMDRYVTDQVKPLLEPGEQVHHQAYVLDREYETGVVAAMRTKAYVAVLTNRRLLLLGAKGAFRGIAIKPGQVERIPRANIMRFATDDRMITAGLADGSTRPMWVFPMKYLSSQHKFLLDVPRILDEQLSAATG